MKKNIYIFILLALCIGRTSFSSDALSKGGYFKRAKEYITDKYNKAEEYITDKYHQTIAFAKNNKGKLAAGGLIIGLAIRGYFVYKQTIAKHEKNAQSLAEKRKTRTSSDNQPTGVTNKEIQKLQKEIIELENIKNNSSPHSIMQEYNKTLEEYNKIINSMNKKEKNPYPHALDQKLTALQEQHENAVDQYEKTEYLLAEKRHQLGLLTKNT